MIVLGQEVDLVCGTQLGRGHEQPAMIAGVADVGADGAIDQVRAVTTRMLVRAQLTGASPI